ncbi:thiol reductant ABC exporter subunit CydD [Catenulispora pinisilvae]|uniref:thiol reductant ABC exporter subunit CydD n=3 Tax=Catenulispora pinisilvae TaxID=2705253 RepID=UPI001892846F|nr:thiol reductant ABC exporter subunit CydD [Catenulispora pinisilvae]
MLDRRLAEHAGAVRPWTALCAVLGTLSALAVIGQAWALASLIAIGFGGGFGFGSAGRAAPTASGVWPWLVALGCCVAVRAGLAWAMEAAAFRAAASVKSALRVGLAAHLMALGPRWLATRKTASLVTLATRGVDGLDGYFARYLPQVVLSATVPAAVLAVLFGADWESGLIVLVTLPLIPLFLWLVGVATRTHVERRRRALDVLAGHFLDVVAGLPDLLVFGRARAQAAAIRRATDEDRAATLRTLRLAFLSSLVLELASTISVAMVAVGIGLRLVAGTLDLRTGLLVLILAPEAYWPLRQVGAFYHASAEGKAAAGEVLGVLETPVPAPVPGPRASTELAGIEINGLTVSYPGRGEPALSDFSLTVAPGECVALVGASGAGKSTVLKALLGFVDVAAGTATACGPIAWVPQRPYLFAGTVAENVRLGAGRAVSDGDVPDSDLPETDLSDAAVWEALRAAAAADFVAALPGGLHARIGEGGHGLSAGQRQRLGLARAFLADRPLVLLDEPTASLDPAAEAEAVASIRSLVADRTAIIVAHRAALLEVADRVVTLGPADTYATHPVDAPPTQGAHRLKKNNLRNCEPCQDPAAQTRARIRPNERLDSGRPTARLALAAALGAAALGSATGLAATSAWLISRASQQPPIFDLMIAITAVRALGIGRAVFRYAERLVAHDAAYRILGSLRARTYDRLCRQAPGRRRGELLARFVADVDAVQDRYVRFLIPALAATAVGTPAVAALAEALPSVALITALGLLATGIAIPLAAARTSAAADRHVAPAKGHLTTELHDLLRGAPDLLAADAVPPRLARVQAADRDLTATERRSAAARGLGTALTTLATGATVWGAAYVALGAVDAGGHTTHQVAAARQALSVAGQTPDAAHLAAANASQAAGAISRAPGTAHPLGTTALQAAHQAAQQAAHHFPPTLLAVLILTPLALLEATAAMPQALQYLRRARAAERRVREVLAAPDAVREPAEPLPLPVASQTLAPHPAAHPTIATRALQVTWPGRTDPALQHLDLDLAPGRKVAVVGPSGSGKTTLISALLRLVDPADPASITLGGVPTTALRSEDVRRVVGLCAQDAHVFDSTLRENLRLARPDATDAELGSVLRQARLADWVGTLPRGLDTFVGEHGARLSGGQHRRLVLARALLAGFPVLLLDEPTEHLDPATADALLCDLLALPQTTLLVTHRLAGLEHVDEIVVLDDGHVVERGTWPELMSRRGVFHSLCRVYA